MGGGGEGRGAWTSTGGVGGVEGCRSGREGGGGVEGWGACGGGGVETATSANGPVHMVEGPAYRVQGTGPAQGCEGEMGGEGGSLVPRAEARRAAEVTLSSSASPSSSAATSASELDPAPPLFLAALKAARACRYCSLGS